MRKVLILLALVAGCNSSDDRPDCASVACTEEFRTITVSVSDPSGVAIPLDAFEVVVAATGEDLTPEYTAESLEIFRQNNAYPMLTDREAETFRNRRVILEFRGFTNETLLVQESFLAGADCCHVDIYEGDTDIIVE